MFFLAAIPYREDIEENDENDNDIWKLKQREQISILGRERKKSAGVYSKREREKEREIKRMAERKR